MEVAIGPHRRAAGACPVGGDRGVNSLSLSQTIAVVKTLYDQSNLAWQAVCFLPVPKLVLRQASRTQQMVVLHRLLACTESPQCRFALP
jgi:hypothetical protein